MRVTLADIARATGLGKSTVARVLSRDRHVSPTARERVLTAARRLGYRPDPALRVLAAHRWQRHPPAETSTLAVITQSVHRPANSPVGTTVNIGHSYLPGLERRARELGYAVDRFDLGSFPRGSRVADVISARGITGIVVTPLIDPQPAFDPDWSQFAGVCCGIGEYLPPLHRVDVSYFSAVRLAWRQCLARGYTRIGGALFRRPGSDHNDSARHAAFLYEQSQQSALAPRLPICEAPLADRDAFLRWFERHRPDAIISLNESPYWWLHETGIACPRDVGFCAINHFPGSTIAGVVRDFDRIAARSIGWLDQLLHHHELGAPATPEEMLIEPAWFEGASLRPVRTTGPVQ